MAEEGPFAGQDDNVTEMPRRRGRPRIGEVVRRTNQPPPVAGSIQDADREALSLWMKERIRLIEEEAAARIELLRTVGEHPSPIFSQMVKKFGALGIKRHIVHKLMGVSSGLFNAHYLADYELGEAEIISSVAANMLRIATSTVHPDAAKVGMDVLNRRGGEEWRPPAQKLEVSKEAGAPPVIDSSKLSPEDREQLRLLCEKAIASGEAMLPELEQE